MNINIECTFCEHDIEVPLQWAVTNGRVYCPCCSKSFDVKVELPEVAVDLAKEDTVDETVVTEVKVPVKESEETVNKDSDVMSLDKDGKIPTQFQVYPKLDDLWDACYDLPF